MRDDRDLVEQLGSEKRTDNAMISAFSLTLRGRLLSAGFPSYQYSVVVYLIVVPAAFRVTMLAAFLPARRASQVDPVLALRQD